MADLWFPSLTPRLSDPLWFCVDRAYDDEHELNKLEEEHQKFLQSVSEAHNQMIPLGKSTATVGVEEADDDDDEHDDVDGDEGSGESDNDDDDLDTDMIDDRDSPDEVEVEMPAVGGVEESPQWILH